MSFNDFVHKYTLKKATANIKIQQVLSSLGLTDLGIYLRDVPFKTDIGLVNLHPSKETHSVCYRTEFYFDSFDCVPPQKLSKIIITRNGYCLYSENQIHKKDRLCSRYCLSIIYLTNVVGMDFKSGLFNLYYQRFS